LSTRDTDWGGAANGLCEHHLLVRLLPNAVRCVLEQPRATGAAGLGIWYDPRGRHRESARLLPLNAPTDCGVAFHCATSTAHPLGMSLPLDAPPPPPTSRSTFVCPGCLLSCFSLRRLCHPSLDPQPFLSTRRLVVATPLVAPPLQLILSARCCLSTRHLHLPLPFASRLLWLVVASLLVAPPLPLILSTRCCLSTRQLIVVLPPVVPLSFSGVVVTHSSWLVVALHLDTPPPPVCRRLFLSSCHCLLSSALTGCCVATSASPRATASCPPGPPPLFIRRLLLLPPTSLSPAVEVD
jgi:hypothetical protein